MRTAHSLYIPSSSSQFKVRELKRNTIFELKRNTIFEISSLIMSEKNQKFDSTEGLKFLTTMAVPSEEPSLPFSVEEMLQRICSEQSLPMPDIQARRELSLIGEEASLLLLQRVRNLTDYITFTARRLVPSRSQESVNFSGLEKSDSSASVYQKDDAILDPMTMEEQNCDLNLPSPNMKEPSQQKSLDFSSLEKPRRQTQSPHLLALAELEFKKAFLILSYCGKKKLEDAITVDTIQRMKNFSMAGFESELWRVLGYNHIEETDRAKSLDWDSEGTFMYHCHVDSDGSYMFKGPYLQKGKTHLQRILGDDNVLLVKFAEDVVAGNSSAVTPNRLSAVYHKVAKEGIFVGLRCYRFYVFKDGGKEEKKKSPTSSPVKCYFACMGSTAPLDEKKPPCILFNKSIREARSVFMHIHTISSIAKYMARFSLILSKSIKLEIDLASVHIQRIEDKPCLDEHGHIVYNEDGEARIHTDGTGFISEDLALKCPRNISRGKYLSHKDLERILSRIALEQSLEFEPSKSHIGEPPCLIQVRLFNNGCAVKGTLLINRKLPLRTIQIRPSMIKVETDPELSDTQSANSLEIVSTSNQPRRTSYLSRYLIALLSYGGVKKDYFMELVVNALEIAQNVHYDKRAALTVALKYGDMDDYLVPRMILCGIPLDEPYVHHRLSVLLNEERKGLMEGKLPVSECYYLMGTSDPTGMLSNDEVCIILEDGQISGKVLVYKHPGLHFGDIHVLNATYVKELENFVGNAKYAIFFPTKGPRSLADEIANSDFDGDMYWVSRNPQLLECFRPCEPWTQAYSAKSVLPQKPSQFSSEELENELFQQFLTTRFNPSATMGIAADSWLSFMDRILTLGDECFKEKECVKEKMLQLIDIYYDALDAPKTGKKVEVPKNLKADKFPHYMNKPNSYDSKSVLGQIYDKVESFRTAEVQLKEEWKLPCFSGEVPEGCMQLWKKLFEQYRVEMTHALKLGDDLKEAAADEVILKYKQILYNASEFNESTRKREDVFNEALAIYNITYDYAKTLATYNSAKRKDIFSRCSFAWKVAGRALCELHIAKRDDDPIVCSKSVLCEIIN